MGTDVRVYMYCDVHGKETQAERTVTVGLDGNWREADLCSDCLEHLLADLTPVIKAGRTPETAPKAYVKRRLDQPNRRPLSEQTSARQRNRLIRAWGDAHGEEQGHPEWAGLQPGEYLPWPLRRAWEESLPTPKSA